MVECQPSIKKMMLMEQFISITLIFRVWIYEVNILIYYLLLLGFLIAKYFKEGNTIGSLLQYVATICLILSEVSKESILMHIGIIIAILNYFFISPTLYTLPDFNPKVGFKDSSSKLNNKEYYVAEWYPIDQKQPTQQYKIPWNHTIQRQKMARYIKITNGFLKQVFLFFTSNVKYHQLTFCKGTADHYHGIILFSHGRGATPFMYSTILKCFARQWKILCPQHSEVHATPYSDINEIKKYRENQVRERASQIVNLAQKGEKIVLMGHSYGCPTVLQAYFSMSADTRKQVSHIILLDPWFFPLTQQVFTQQFSCPILILANQYFLQIKDVNQRNRKFITTHKQKLIYICWKGGDHLHQTDMAFINGNSLRKIKNSQQCWSMMKKNIQSISMFLSSDRITLQLEQQFKDKYAEFDVGINYTPQKWRDSITF